MFLIRRQAYARAGLIGNPSDGYNGRTISLIVRDYSAQVILYEWEDVEIVQTEMDQSRFGSVQDLVKDVKLHGYYGGVRLIKATIKRFVEYCEDQGHSLHDRNFSIRYQSNIPRQVGLAGSSAIIVATLRCLMAFYDVTIPEEVQPSLALSVENDELGITAGLQDRVIQIYEGLVFMDFAESQRQVRCNLVHYHYEKLNPGLLPPIYIAFSTDVGEPTEVFHNNIRARYEQGDPTVVNAMTKCANLAAEARTALLRRDSEKLSYLIDENFNTRRSIYRLPQGQVDMVEAARSVGASGKFAGSGGAIIGVYHNDEIFARLTEVMEDQGCRVLKPTVLSKVPNG